MPFPLQFIEPSLIRWMAYNELQPCADSKGSSAIAKVRLDELVISCWLVHKILQNNPLRKLTIDKMIFKYIPGHHTCCYNTNTCSRMSRCMSLCVSVLLLQHLYLQLFPILVPPLMVNPFKFCQGLWQQKTRVPGLCCAHGVVCDH